jgi:GNAT superfamily N-acetyltransferase
MTQSNQSPKIIKQFTVEPVTKKNWNKFVELFGDRGACANCWCMYYRSSKVEFEEGKVEDENKRRMKEIIWSDKPVGLIGLIDGLPVAWCAFAPREDFIKLEKSRVHKRIDNSEVWSIPCFFIDKHYRNSGISVQLLLGAIDYARQIGIKIIEAYPTIPTKARIPDSFAWIGLYKSFERAGFEIVDRTSKNRPMVRYYLDS